MSHLFRSTASRVSFITKGFLFAHLLFHWNPIPASYLYSYSAYAYVNPIAHHSTHSVSYIHTILSKPDKFTILNSRNNRFIDHDAIKHRKRISMIQMKNENKKDVENVENVVKRDIIHKSITKRLKIKMISLYGMVSKRIVRTKGMMKGIVPESLLKRTRWHSKILSKNHIDAIQSKSTINASTLPSLTFLNPLDLDQETITTQPTMMTTNESTITMEEIRSETCHPTTDLSGSWSLVISPEFKHEYDLYLKAFHQPAFFRAVALHPNVLSMTKETLIQTKNGKELIIKGTNPRGVWERTLCSKVSSVSSDNNTAILKIRNAGGAIVEAESWWDSKGKCHLSWVRKAKEGDFFSKRYINDEGYYVCESSFFCKLKDGSVVEQPTAQMTWTFQRNEMNSY